MIAAYKGKCPTCGFDSELLNSASAVDALVSCDNWTASVPTAQGWYWHWSGDMDNAPYIYHVLYSHGAKKCFIPKRQAQALVHECNKRIFCDEYNGYWMHIEQPRLPDGFQLAIDNIASK